MHAIGALPNAVRLQQMVEQVLARFKVLAANGAGHPLRRRRVNVGHVLLEVADGAVAAAALFAKRFRLDHGAADVGATAAGADTGASLVGAAGASTSSSTSCNPTTARCHSS